MKIGGLDTIKTLINLQSQRDYAARISSNTSNASNTRGKGDGFTLEDIVTDEHYLKAKESLDKRFKDFEIVPEVLNTEGRFGILTELMEDKDFDFDDFCGWYEREINDREGFGFGLLLHKSVIKRYRYYVDHPNRYLKTTTNLEHSESFKRMLKETDENFLKPG